MNRVFKQLETILDLVPMQDDQADQTAQPPAVLEHADLVVHHDDVEQAQKLSKDTLKRMIEKSERMLDSIMQIADATESPRAFEVASTIVKTITDVVGKFDEIASKQNQAPTSKETTQTNIHSNYLFVGSSEELIKLLRSKSSNQSSDQSSDQ